MSVDRYRVTAPYITVKVEGRNGAQVIGLTAGALVPDNTVQESIDHHLSRNMIEKLEQPRRARRTQDTSPPEEPPQGAGEQPPSAGATEGVAVNARSSKGDLVEHAVSHGMSREDAEGMTRDQLIDKFVRTSGE